MKTVPVADRVESHTLDTGFGFLVVEGDSEEAFDSYSRVEDMPDEDLAKVATRFKCSPELLRELDGFFSELKNNIHRDLADIWEKV